MFRTMFRTMLNANRHDDIDLKSRLKVGPQLAKSRLKVGAKLAQSRPKVDPKSTQKLAQTWPKVGPEAV